MRRTAPVWYAGPAAAFAPPPPSAPRRIIPVDPAHARLAHARSALQSGDARVALACFTDATHLDPRLAIAHLGRALCLAEIGDHAEASEALLDALALPDQTGEVTMHLARMLAKEGSHHEAMDLLAQAFSLDENLVEAAYADPSFRSLGDHPRFLQLVGRL